MSTSHGYVEDKYGDVQSARYGRTSLGDVPRYIRIGQGCVLGLNTGLRIARHERGETGSVVIGPKGKQRLLDQQGSKRHSTSTQGVKRLKRRQEVPDPAFTSGQDHLEVAGPSRSQAPSGSGKSWLGEQYLDTSSGCQRRDHDADDDEEDEVEESDVQSVDYTLHEEVRSLSKQVRDNPQDMQAWLKLASLQSRLQQHRIDTIGKRATLARSKAVAEVQLSVLDKALEAHEDNRHDVYLLLSRLGIVVENGLWDEDEIAEEYSRISGSARGQDLATDIDVQQRLLHWQVGVAKTLDEAVHSLSRSISDVRQAAFEVSRSQIPVLERTYIRLLQQVAELLCTAGYVERATSILQAQCELAFDALRSVDVSSRAGFEDACRQLALYWDSEEPRIGETGAQGFASFIAALEKDRSELRQRYKEGHTDGVAPSFGSMPEGLSSTDPIERYRSLDESRNKLRVFGARTLDKPDWTTGELEVDPDAFIFFDDIRDLLFPLQTADARQALFAITAHHFGLEAAAFPDRDWASSDEELPHKQSLWPLTISATQKPQHTQTVDGQVMSSAAASTLGRPFGQPFKNLTPPFIDELFGQLHGQQDRTWFGHWDVHCVTAASSSAAVAFLGNCARSHDRDLRAVALVSRIGVAAAQQTPKAVNKLAKRLLAVNKDNKTLWLAYAQYQYILGEVALARQICQNLLQAEAASREGEIDAVAQVWWLWTCLEWEQGDFIVAQNIVALAIQHRFGSASATALTSASIATSLDAMQLLRARKTVRTLLDSTKNAFAARAIASCAALLEYFVTSDDDAFDRACQRFDHILHLIVDEPASSSSAEQIALAYAKLLWRHTQRDIPQACRSRRYEPMRVRQTLHRLSGRFPSNAHLFALLAAFEMSVKFENGLRRTLDSRVHALTPHDADLRVLDDGDIRLLEITYMQYLYTVSRLRRDHVNVSAVRSLLERGVTTPNLRNNRRLWHSYLELETLHCTKKIVQAQEGATGVTTTRKESKSRDGTPDWSKQAHKAASKELCEALARAKRVFYRAIQARPLDKDLYMSAFRAPLRQAFDIDELRGIARALDERGLRTFASLDVFLVNDHDVIALEASSQTGSDTDADMPSDHDE